MSSLLNKLQKDGSQLSLLDGKTSPVYNGRSQYQKDLETSQLDLDGKKPLEYNRQTIQIANLTKPKTTKDLDLNGRTPEKYKNPETGATY